MKRIVMDASTIAAAIFEEQHAEAARGLLKTGGQLHAPDLIVPEFANILWKRARRGEITADEAADLLEDFESLPLFLMPSSDVAEAALKLAVMTGRTVYDCLYLATAIEVDAVMFTADERLVNSLSGTPLAKRISWIGHKL